MLRDPKYEVSFSEYSSVSKVGPFSHCCCGSVTSLEIQCMCVHGAIYVYKLFSYAASEQAAMYDVWKVCSTVLLSDLHTSTLSTMYNTLTCS